MHDMQSMHSHLDKASQFSFGPTAVAVADHNHDHNHKKPKQLELSPALDCFSLKLMVSFFVARQ